MCHYSSSVSSRESLKFHLVHCLADNYGNCRLPRAQTETEHPAHVGRRSRSSVLFGHIHNKQRPGTAPWGLAGHSSVDKGARPEKAAEKKYCLKIEKVLLDPAEIKCWRCNSNKVHASLVIWTIWRRLFGWESLNFQERADFSILLSDIVGYYLSKDICCHVSPFFSPQSCWIIGS